MKKYLSRFADIDRDKDGLITVEDMVLYLRVPQDAYTESVFKSLRPVSLCDLHKNDLSSVTFSFL